MGNITTVQMLVKSTWYYPYFDRKNKINVTEAKVGIICTLVFILCSAMIYGT